MADVKLYLGDCLDIMRGMDAESVDSIVTDPPYGLSFMGKNWDHGVPGVAYWEEALRVAKPGAYLLAFGGTRTFHRLTCAIEDAGWEIRDTIGWIYGQGFPKSHDVGKAIDKMKGAKREKLYLSPNRRPGHEQGKSWKQASPDSMNYHITAPATPEAQQWDGWGTALKPAWEPVIVARKPIPGTVAENVLQYGTGAMNIDGCRVAVTSADVRDVGREITRNIRNGDDWGMNGEVAQVGVTVVRSDGRWPANVIHDGSDEVLALFPQSNGGAYPANGAQFGYSGGNRKQRGERTEMMDSGSAARFFYCAKASKADRNEGLPEGQQSNHPTVKPEPLMRYLCKLVTPPGGVVFDPFMGSGSTGKAAVKEGFAFIGCDNEPEYIQIAECRIPKEVTIQTEMGF